MRAAVLALAVVALFAATAAAQTPCKMPQLWSASRFEFDPNQRRYHNHTSEFRIAGKYAYDGVNERKWMRDEVRTGDDPQQEYFEILEIHQEKKAYVTDLRTKDCKIYTITEPFHRHDIHDGARFEGYEIYGSYPDSLTLSQWFTPNATYRGTSANFYQTFTDKCVPVRDDKFGDAFGFTYEEFSDVSIGANPNIWIPPSNCKPSQ